MSTHLQRHSTTIFLGMNSWKESAAMLLVGVLICLPVLTNASNTTTASSTSTTTATITTATDIIPKVIIAIAVIAFAAGIGVGVAKLLDYIYDHSRLNDNASDMSEHTKEMLKTQMILMKMKTKKKKLGDEEQGDGEPKKQSKLKSLVQRVASARPKSKEEGSDKNLNEEADKQTSSDMKDSVENETDGAKTEAAKTESETQVTEKPTDDKIANEKPSNASKDESDPKLKKAESKDALHTGHASVTRTTSDMLGSVGGPSASAVKDKPTPTAVKDKQTPTATSGAASPTTPRAQSSKSSPRRDSSPGGKHLAGQLPAGKKGSTAGNSS
ncbi:uncharacterized protein LOC106174170 [Lingula anatina]|uniref:Uncharacterized protein LOC106174170 n=1 Tax=Lingula anatina TaxID=7574 RepID=A0A1S3JLP1_LINAN|nr:uncharacterized protein LOC106174170 [Lingula anatina]|eukprot:XP_013411046.1 uncharacterized protein LOC106174170 [Lingula anatina]